MGRKLRHAGGRRQMECQDHRREADKKEWWNSSERASKPPRWSWTQTSVLSCMFLAIYCCTFVLPFRCLVITIPLLQAYRATETKR